MNLIDDLRETASTPVYAVVGITDLAVETARRAQARAAEARAQVRAQVRADLDPNALQVRALQLQAQAQRVPLAAVSRGMETAARAEERYDELAQRGRSLVERVRRQRATQELIAQGKVTLSRGKAAVTTVRRVVDDTVPAVRDTARTARHDAAEVAEDTRARAQTRTRTTRAAAKRTTDTATRRARTAKSTTRSAATSARKTATKAAKAGAAAADKVGD
jgi:heparin binding hemagglutinin HbhA